MDLVTRMRLCAEDLHCANAATEAVQCLSLGADAVYKLECEVAQWKNNHATVVAQARILKERDDMPIERVRAYENWQKATVERDSLATQNDVLRKALATVEGWIIIPERNCSCHISPPCSNCIDKGNAEFDDEQVKAALALPDLSADILHARDARVLWDAVQKMRQITCDCGAPCDCFTQGSAIRRFMRMADELERKPLRDMTEADFNEAHGGRNG